MPSCYLEAISVINWRIDLENFPPMSPGNHRRFAMYNVAWRFEFPTWYDFIQEIVPIWRQYHAGDGVSLMLTHCGLVMPYGVSIMLEMEWV